VLRLGGPLVHVARVGKPGDRCGLPELVVTSRDEYTKAAIALGRDRPRLAAMAAKLRATRDTLPLFDLDRYTRAFESVIERAWRETPLD
jgi:predicted O-linked N-acetylglucosamine transferase (SPINDLY family)